MINVTRLSDRAYGYKVFNPDWSCNPREHDAQGQYTCPARFEDDEMDVQKRGMTFRTNPIGYFKSGFYKFDSNTHVVEVIAYGDIGKVNMVRYVGQTNLKLFGNFPGKKF